jgi:two-component system response regulator YesN
MQEDVRQVLQAIEKGTLREDDTAADGGAKSLCDRFPDVHPAIRKALRIIEASYGEKISQKELSESLGMTQEYFSTLFTHNVGEGFGKFLKCYRIDRAKKMLREGADVADTAARCGIANVKYFNQIFRDQTGKTPSEYRMNNGDRK